MPLEASSIVDESIDTQLQSAESQSVREFVVRVEERVKAEITDLQEIHGDVVRDIAGEAMAEVRGYKETRLRLFDPDFDVKDTEQKGAAAWNDKSDNSIAISHSAMSRESDAGYWGRVVKHEETHQLEQTASFNAGSIMYPGDVLEVNPTLVEWHAITMANQPDSDLTPEYRSHKRRGDALVAFLGSAAPLKAALASGDMLAFQALIDERLQEEERVAA